MHGHFRECGNAVSRDGLLNEIWGVEYYGTTRTLHQLIVKLRQKIEDVPGESPASAHRPYAGLSAESVAGVFPGAEFTEARYEKEVRIPLAVNAARFGEGQFYRELSKRRQYRNRAAFLPTLD